MSIESDAHQEVTRLVTRDTYRLCGFLKEQATIEFTLPRTSFLIGEVIPLKFEIDNSLSSSEILEICIELKRVYKPKKHLPEWGEREEVLSWFYINYVKPGENKQEQGMLQIPLTEVTPEYALNRFDEVQVNGPVANSYNGKCLSVRYFVSWEVLWEENKQKQRGENIEIEVLSRFVEHKVNPESNFTYSMPVANVAAKKLLKKSSVVALSNLSSTSVVEQIQLIKKP